MANRNRPHYIPDGVIATEFELETARRVFDKIDLLPVLAAAYENCLFEEDVAHANEDGYKMNKYFNASHQLLKLIDTIKPGSVDAIKKNFEENARKFEDRRIARMMHL